MDLGTQFSAVMMYLGSTIMARGTVADPSPLPIRTALNGMMRKLLQSEGATAESVVITDMETAICGALIILTCILSALLKLGLTTDILIAALRAAGQLILLGYILEPVFATETIWAVGVIIFVLNTVGAREIYAQCDRYYGRLYFDCWVSIGIAWVLPCTFAMAFVIKVDPWYRPQYIIPMVGMVLGNVLKGVQLALDSYTMQIVETTPVEVFLCRGATPWEATAHIRARAVRVGMTPTINLMTIMGVVSIPGMMTGQIMGGTPPLLAAKYQIVLIFLIAASSLVGIVVALLFVQQKLFKENQLFIKNLTRRSQKSKDIVTESFRAVAKVVKYLISLCRSKKDEKQPLLRNDHLTSQSLLKDQKYSDGKSNLHNGR